MINFLAPALTMEEKKFLWEQRQSEHFRVYDKAITYLWSLKAAELASATPDTLLKYQGVIQGLTIAKNLLSLGAIPENT